MNAQGLGVPLYPGHKIQLLVMNVTYFLNVDLARETLQHVFVQKSVPCILLFL